MKRLARFAQVGMLTLALLAAFGCTSDNTPTAAPAPEAGLIGDATGLLLCTARPYYRAEKVFGPAGGVLQVGPHVLSIPAGALAASVKITAEAPVGSVNSVRFSPEGLTFAKSASLTMSYSNCNLLGQLLLPKRIAYTSELLSILSYVPSVDKYRTKQVTGQLDHFSRYAVAW